MRYLMLIAVLCSCHGSSDARYLPDADASYEITITSTDAPYDYDAHPASVCRQACSVLRSFGCPEGQDVEGGDPCETICLNTQATGIFDLHPECVAKAMNKEQLQACGVCK